MRVSNGRLARAWVLYRCERTENITNYTNRLLSRDIEARNRIIFSQLRSSLSTSAAVPGDVLSTDNSRVALIMGVANQRSIAWSCVQRFLLDHGRTNRHGQRPWKLILTCQNDKIRSKVEMMAKSLIGVGADADNTDKNPFLGICSVDVSDPVSMKAFFHGQLPEILQNDSPASSSSSSPSSSSIDAVVHSIAFAPNLKKHSLLKTSQEDFMIAHQISSYSLIDVTRNVLPYMNPCSTASTTNSDGGGGGGGNNNNNTSSITTLSYLGSEVAIPGYNVMGPAKASLESVVRGLAYELGSYNSGSGAGVDDDGSSSTSTSRHPASRTVRVNAIRAGPISTISSKGGISNFQDMLRDVENRSPLRRNVTSEEVASTVYHVAAEATGLTGQTINVDGGYSIVSGPVV